MGRGSRGEGVEGVFEIPVSNPIYHFNHPSVLFQNKKGM